MSRSLFVGGCVLVAINTITAVVAAVFVHPAVAIPFTIMAAVISGVLVA